MTDNLAAEGFVVLSVGWQTFERSPSDDLMSQLVQDSVDFLSARDDVDAERLGLTGFCAGGRYTMLFLPQLEAFGGRGGLVRLPQQRRTCPGSVCG